MADETKVQETEGKEEKKLSEEQAQRQKLYGQVAQAIGKEFGLTEVPRVREGLLIEDEGKDIVLRVIVKKTDPGEIKETFKVK